MHLGTRSLHILTDNLFITADKTKKIRHNWEFLITFKAVMWRPYHHALNSGSSCWVKEILTEGLIMYCCTIKFCCVLPLLFWFFKHASITIPGKVLQTPLRVQGSKYVRSALSYHVSHQWAMGAWPPSTDVWTYCVRNGLFKVTASTDLFNHFSSRTFSLWYSKSGDFVSRDVSLSQIVIFSFCSLLQHIIHFQLNIRSWVYSWLCLNKYIYFIYNVS